MKHKKLFLFMVATLLCSFGVNAQITDVSQFSNDAVYFVSQPHHSGGATSWAIAEGGTALQTNVQLGIDPDPFDPRQQFAFITNDGGATYYLYHPAEGKYVYRWFSEGGLQDSPTDPISFMEGAYDATFLMQFSTRCINVNDKQAITIDSYKTPDGGNSCRIVPVPSDPNTECSVTYYGWDGTVLKDAVVKWGQQITPPAAPSREGYYFAGWSKSVSEVYLDMEIHAIYRELGTPITGLSQLNDSYLCHLSYYNGVSLAVDIKGDALKANGQLGFANSQEDGRQLFAFITPDGGATYYLYHPAEMKYINKDGSLGDTPTDPIYIIPGKYENTFHLYFDNRHHIRIYHSEYDPGSVEFNSGSSLDESNSCTITPVCKRSESAAYSVAFLDWDGTLLHHEFVEEGQSATPPADPVCEGAEFLGWNKDYKNVQSRLVIKACYKIGSDDTVIAAIEQLSNDAVCLVSQPHHGIGTTSWAIAQGGNALKTNVELGLPVDIEDTRQQFAFVTNDEGQTYYLYHPAEQKYVNKDGSLSATPQDVIKFKGGQYANSFVVYFDDSHYINVNGEQKIVINSYKTPDGGNSCTIAPLGGVKVTVFNDKDDPNKKYTVRFCDMDGTVLKNDAVLRGQSATPPAAPQREGFTFMAWNKELGNIQTGTIVYAIYTHDETGHITSLDLLDNEQLWLVSQRDRPTSWAIDKGGSMLKTNVLLNLESNKRDLRQLFSFVSYDGGQTHYLYHPAEKKYVNIDGSLGDTPVDPIHIERITDSYLTNGYVYFAVYFDETHYIKVTTSNSKPDWIEITKTLDTRAYNLFVPVNEEELDAEYTVTFYDWNDAVLKTEQVKNGQSATAPTSPQREGYAFIGWDTDFRYVYSDLSVKALYGNINAVLPAAAPRAELWYDFMGVGEKGFVKDHYFYYDYFDVAFTAGISQQFKTIKSYSGSDELSWSATCYIEDLNRDGVVDISTAGANSLLSQGGEFEHNAGMLIVPNFDINNDGRLDYLKSKGNNSWSIMVHQADGSFVEQFMHVMTEEEYESTFDPENWQSTTTQKSAFTVVAVGGWSSSVRFSGVSLASAPPRREANAPQMRAQGMNPTVGAPTRALDLNADGYVDLIDEKNGVLYYNGGEGRWIRNELGGAVVVADLNGDHIQDFIFPGQELWVAVYRGDGDFEVQTLYQNIQVDREMYCYDFDRDGDVDILVTFSAPLNSTGYAYTMFFDNDGTGKFTQLDEQDYGNNNLLFSNCQDLDGDGYYDLLAFRGDLKGRTGQDLVWLKGQPDKTFADPESLVSITDGKDVNSAKISVEDINNDGRMDVWADVDGVPSYSFAGASNTAPTAPAKPEFTYNGGWLTIIWGDGSDDRTATSDLTYALRVGTTPGGDDILRAHANADGTRRNFLDGNMSKFQTYALDLRSRQPATIYVSVQTIDAQHVGSAWSEEASIEHTGAFADFRVSKTELGCGEKLTATALAMPDGFTHTWTAEDGTCTGNGHEVEVVFTAAGEKAITHTLTSADGTSTLYVEMVNVLPNYMDIMNDHIMTDKDYDFFVEEPHNRNVADYNMDGYWDKFYRESSSSIATRAAVVLNGGEGYSYTQAVGIWNTGLQANGRGTHFWYDWDHNGAADLLCSEDDNAEGAIYYLPHNGTNNMKAKQTDSNLEQLFMNARSGGYSLHPVDYTHDGNYDMFYKKTQYGNYEAFMYTRQSDGSYQSRSISGDVSNKTWYEVVGEVPNVFAAPEGRIKSRSVDINHDGFIDIAYFDSQERVLVLVNKGNCSFEKLSIPFETALSNEDFSYYSTRLADMNNDGYYDLVVRRGTDAAIYVMWNEKNQRFAAPEVLPLGELEEFYKEYSAVNIEDLDNNGYLDIITAQQDKSKGDMGHGMYVHYFGAEGVIYQGFVAQGEYFRYIHSFNDNLFKLPNHPWTFAGYDYLGFDNVDTGGSWAPDESYRYCLFPIHGGENERPSAPTEVRAAQTAKGLVIEWNHAQDDATPGVQMRYNLSLKKKGASGEGAYIISPQNACNSNAAPMREYNYINAKQYIVPLSVLPLGEYEIQLQAIDLQGDWSVFTEPLTVTIEDMVAIDGPTSACTEEAVQFIYGGTPTDETPVWNFDGCSSYSGSGFGPYSVLWSTPGTKTITLTLGDKVVKHMLYVSESGANMILPSYVFNNMTFDLDLPANMDVEFLVRPYRSSEMEELPWGNGKGYTAGYSKEVKIEGNKLIINNVVEREWEFKAIVANDNGCDVEIISKKRIYEKSDLPFISHVTTNAEGQNVIYITNTSGMSRKARVLKETNRRDQYVEIGVSEGGSLTDVSSNASAQAERYVVQPILEDGTVTPFYSSTHQTSHLTINRGLTDNTWNLIWSHYEYEGADIVSYNILRGSSPSDLEEIVSISSRHNSYTDVTLDPGKPYYAIEYVLSNAGASAPSMKRAATRAYNPSGRSNVVNSNMANTIVYANKVSVLSATKKYEMSEENPALALYAEILPAAATSRNVRWEIIDGNDLATITSSGVLMANNPNRGGVVTVQATTIDGTNLTATRQITVAAMGDMAPEPEPETTYTVTFYDWNGAILKAQTVKQGEAATAPTAPTRTGYTFAGWDTDFTNVQSDLSVTATYTQNSQPVTTYTVKFCDWNGTVLKTQTVQQGQSATAPTAPTREGYTFTGWDKNFTNVQGDLFVYAMYTQNSVEPEPDSELKYTTQFNAGANGWIEGTVWYNQTEKIVAYTSPLYRAQGDKVTKLRITVNRDQKGDKFFCLSELEFYDANGSKIALSASNVTSNADHNALNAIPDGGGLAALFDGQTSTYFHSAWQNMPVGDHYLEITLPNGGYDAFSFKMLSRARTIENGRVYDQSHTFPGVMVMATAVELVVSGTPEPEPEYTVTFYDWNNTVLKTQKVKKGEAATAPANPTREGYTFTGWDKAFANVQSDLNVYAVYTQNVQPDPDPQPELDNDAVYYISQPYNGGTSWAIAEGGSAMNINTKLGITADGADARQQFAFITNDGGKTHYLYHPAEKKYVNKDNTLSTTPRDAVYFMAGAYENTFVVYFDNDHVINTNSTDGLIINRWGPLSGWGQADGGNSCQITAVEQTPEPEPTYTVTFYDWDNTVLKTQTVVKGQSATAPAAPTREGYTFTGWDKSFTNVQANLSVKAVYTQNSVEPDPQPELNNETLYYVSQPYHEKGATSWAIAQGGSGLQTNVELNVTADGADTRQQFAFISNDGGKTHYLYHPAERKYVNMDGSLSATPQDAVYFKAGAYANTFVVYFDEAHFINVDQYRMLLVNDWGPGGRIGVADGGNSCLITPVGKFDISNAINFMTVDGPQRVQKVLEEGTWYIILPDGSKYTMTGVRVK